MVASKEEDAVEMRKRRLVCVVLRVKEFHDMIFGSSLCGMQTLNALLFHRCLILSS